MMSGENISNSPKVIVGAGAQWGDEGKAKVLSALFPFFDICARFQGGHNAGHSVKVGGLEVATHLIPSAIVDDGVTCLLGNNMVIDPLAFQKEVRDLEALGINCTGRILVSNRAHLILPYHRAREKAHEQRLGKEAIGTTLRGIGMAYEDKARRSGLRVHMLAYPGLFEDKMRQNLEDANLLLKALGADAVDESEFEGFTSACLFLQSFAWDVGKFLRGAIKKGQSVIIEGAQATMLDIDQGTYPFVTSSQCTAAGAAMGLGIPFRSINAAFGVAKAYTTRVGGGPFPTVLNDAIGQHIAKTGHEFGTSTGRPRDCGWFDAFQVGYAQEVNGFDSIAVTKLDILDYLDEVKVCVGYRCDGGELGSFPVDAHILDRCEPIYRSFEGWQTSTVGITEIEKLPYQARGYLDFIAEQCGVEIGFIGTGPEQSQRIIVRGSPFEAWIG